MAEKITAVKGMNDLLPQDAPSWLFLEQKLQSWLSSYAYTNIRPPILEATRLFTRSIGNATDIVEKEMYSFNDSLNGDALSLRPEGTAGIVRAVIENNLLYQGPQKLWSLGPMFRHERPQKGRYRQFHQLSVEALGLKGPDIDCEMIVMLNELWAMLGLTNLKLQINCLGDSGARANYRAALINYFEQHIELLDADATRRLYSNPLRILDTKNQALAPLIAAAPRLIDYLNDESLKHYNQWQALLTELAIDYTENPRLVRGLDYYNLLVFEWVSTDLGSQATICGGGRYDPLIAELGGADNHAIGFAIGIERLWLTMQTQGKLPANPNLDVYIVNEGGGTAELAFKLARQLRAAGYTVNQNLGGGNFKTQFKRANNCQARFSLVIGENEVKSKQLVVKSMADQTQVSLAHDQLLVYLNAQFNC